MFQLKDMVVYPSHGVAVIKDVIEKNVAGVSLKFFKLVFVYKDMTILVPVNSLEATGMRELSRDTVLSQALAEFDNKPDRPFDALDLSPSGWNKRNKEYQSRIQAGRIEEVAKIYRDLMHISRQKELSFGEKSLLAMVEDLLVQEVCAIRSAEKSLVLEELRAPFKRLTFMQQGKHSAQQGSAA